MNYTNFIKDLNYAVKRVATKPEVLDTFTKDQVADFHTRVLNYAPKAETGIYNRSLALKGIELKQNPQPDMTVAEKIANETCVLEIHVRQPGFSKKINSSTFLDRNGNEGKVDSDVLHVSQDLIDKRRISELEQHRNSLLDYIKAWSLNSGRRLTLGNGQFLMPLSMVDKVRDRIEQFGENRQILLNDFEEQWDEIKEDARVKRGVFYSENDYPTFDKVRARYSHDYKFISNTVPQELEKVSKALYDQEKKRIILECSQVANDAKQALREELAGLVEHCAERLGTDEAGKPKRFNEKRLTDLKDFIEMFSVKNILEDDALQTVAEKASKLIEGVDVKQIRTDQDFRESLKKGFESIKAEVSTMVETKKRKITID